MKSSFGTVTVRDISNFNICVDCEADTQWTRLVIFWPPECPTYRCPANHAAWLMHIEHYVASNMVRASINMPNLYGMLAKTKRLSFKGYSSGFYWPGGTKIGIWDTLKKYSTLSVSTLSVIKFTIRKMTRKKNHEKNILFCFSQFYTIM